MQAFFYYIAIEALYSLVDDVQMRFGDSLYPIFLFLLNTHLFNYTAALTCQDFRLSGDRVGMPRGKNFLTGSIVRNTTKKKRKKPYSPL